MQSYVIELKRIVMECQKFGILQDTLGEECINQDEENDLSSEVEIQSKSEALHGEAVVKSAVSF